MYQCLMCITDIDISSWWQLAEISGDTASFLKGGATWPQYAGVQLWTC